MIFKKFYKTIYFFILIIIVIMIATPIVLKINLHNLKAINRSEIDYNISRKDEFAENSIPIYDILKIINRIDEVTIENINLNGGYKEIILNSDGGTNLIKQILEELTVIEEVFHITKISLKENLWEITVIFN